MDIKMIDPKVELLEGNDIFKSIELAGRTCYKSEDKITDDSAKGFVERMMQNKHTAMLEHGTVYLTIEVPCDSKGNVDKESLEYDYIQLMSNNPYSQVRFLKTPSYKYTGFITTNYRVLYESPFYEELQKYITSPTIYHNKRISFRIVTNRQVSHELVRSRHFSFAQESTRYCDYTRSKFNLAMTFLIPSFLKNMIRPDDKFGYRIVDARNNEVKTFIDYLHQVTYIYAYLKDHGEMIQNCALVLPNALKTEIVMTGFLSDWKYFLNLRYFERTGKVHPDMKVISTMIYNQLKEKGYIK